MRVDTPWFTDLIRQSSFGSIRRIARRIKGRHGRPLDPSAISLMLRGKRAMQLQEARQFADLLDVPLVEVLRRAGLAVPDEGSSNFRVAGHIDKNGQLHMNNGKGTERVPGPMSLAADSIAVRCQTARSEHALMDGWVLYASKPKRPDPDLLGRFALVSPKPGKACAAVVLRGYKPDTYNLVTGMCFTPTKTEENVKIEWAAPIVWIRP